MVAPIGPIVSEQGVALSCVVAHDPVGAGSDRSGAVDQMDDQRHHLVWSASSGLQVRTSDLSFMIAAPYGLWLPAATHYTVESSSR